MYDTQVTSVERITCLEYLCLLVVVLYSLCELFMLSLAILGQFHSFP